MEEVSLVAGAKSVLNVREETFMDEERRASASDIRHDKMRVISEAPRRHLGLKAWF